MKPITFLVIFTFLLVSCSSAPSANTVQTAIAQTQAAQSVQPTQEQKPVVVQPTETNVPIMEPTSTATLAPTSTHIPTATLEPTPAYSQPVVLVEFTGTGNTITDDYTLPACWKAVLYWQVGAGSYGTASLILKSYNKDTGNDKTLVNEFAMDLGADGLSGSAFDPLLGGTYYFSTENTDEAWTARIECLDGIAPVGTGIDIQAEGGVVTDNYTLPTCNKSIFNWRVGPSSSGTASIILALCDMKACSTIVNEFKMDMTEPLTGQALQAVKAGDYFLVSANTQESWSVTWECKD